jgi:hypothetical protein
MAVDMTGRSFAGREYVERMTEKIEQAMRLAARARYVLLATVDVDATPRLTPVEQCTPAGGGIALPCTFSANRTPPADGSQCRPGFLLSGPDAERRIARAHFPRVPGIFFLDKRRGPRTIIPRKQAAASA